MSTQSSRAAAAAEQHQIRLLREAGPGRRLALALQLSDLTRAMAWRALKRARPESSRDELALRFIEIHYGSDLAAMVSRSMSARPQ